MGLLMATVKRDWPETESVSVKHDGDEVTLVFPDEEITFKLDELMDALSRKEAS